ncbi:ChbG/HpnK family deacetylase [Pelagibacterales bacterium SAG-MED09]|nr:ChbG/HpnK family deacetylase [Pelagibacterales bacterium SAG-MED09]
MIKKIHFHADDFGRSKLISKNILKCIKSKNINSISVLVGFDEKFFSYIKKKKINIKLHINLTEGYKNFLINQNYTFFELLFLQLHPNFSQHKKKIINQIETQIKYFKKKFKTKKIKIDSHEHVHVIPWINKILTNLKKKHKIIEIRNPSEKYYFVKFKYFMNFTYLTNLLKLALIKFLNLFNNVDKNNNFTGLNYTGIQNFETIKMGIKLNIKSKKNLEVLIHPGYTNANERKKFNKKYFKYYNSSERLKELQIASSKNFFKNLIN